jgi:hypothetical protein
MVIAPAFLAVVTIVSTSDFSSECQHQWHGPFASGTHGDLPVQWNEMTCVEWKVAVPGEE